MNKSVHILVCNGKHCRKAENKNVFTSIKNEIIYRRLESKVDVQLSKCCDHCDNTCVVTVEDEQKLFIDKLRLKLVEILSINT